MKINGFWNSMWRSKPSFRGWCPKCKAVVRGLHTRCPVCNRKLRNMVKWVTR